MTESSSTRAHVARWRQEQGEGDGAGGESTWIDYAAPASVRQLGPRLASTQAAERRAADESTTAP